MIPFQVSMDKDPRALVADHDGLRALDEPAHEPLAPTAADVGAAERRAGRPASGVVELYRPAESPLQAARAGRRKLWEIPHKYHCPIIGTSLTVDELRRIGDKFIWRAKDGRLSDYEVHVGFVSAAEQRNALSQATQRLLDKKYAAAVKRYGKARAPEEVRVLWSESLASGEVPAALWALMTHPRTDAETMALAYEDVHMLSHQIGAGQRADLKRLSETRLELERARRELEAGQKRSQRQADEHGREIERLETRLGERALECDCLRARVQECERQVAESGLSERLQLVAGLREQTQTLQSRLETLERENAGLRAALSDAEARGEGLRARLEEKASECEALERILALGMADQCGDCPNEGCACRADLAGRVVLCVGGRKPLVEQYRQLVARCNGRFEHHDGGLEDSHHRLEAMLAAADAIVCATDYVSHSAYYRTKRFCKRLDKPHVLLGNSGLSAFARALEQVAN